jgi:hypothetical protein
MTRWWHRRLMHPLCQSQAAKGTVDDGPLTRRGSKSRTASTTSASSQSPCNRGVLRQADTETCGPASTGPTRSSQGQVAAQEEALRGQELRKDPKYNATCIGGSSPGWVTLGHGCRCCRGLPRSVQGLPPRATRFWTSSAASQWMTQAAFVACVECRLSLWPMVLGVRYTWAGDVLSRKPWATTPRSCTTRP